MKPESYDDLTLPEITDHMESIGQLVGDLAPNDIVATVVILANAKGLYYIRRDGIDADNFKTALHEILASYDPECGEVISLEDE